MPKLKDDFEATNGNPNPKILLNHKLMDTNTQLKKYNKTVKEITDKRTLQPKLLSSGQQFEKYKKSLF